MNTTLPREGCALLLDTSDGQDTKSLWGHRNSLFSPTLLSVLLTSWYIFKWTTDSSLSAIPHIPSVWKSHLSPPSKHIWNLISAPYLSAASLARTTILCPGHDRRFLESPSFYLCHPIVYFQQDSQCDQFKMQATSCRSPSQMLVIMSSPAWSEEEQKSSRRLRSGPFLLLACLLHPHLYPQDPAGFHGGHGVRTEVGVVGDEHGLPTPLTGQCPARAHGYMQHKIQHREIFWGW